jgi:hypothetical protein
VSSEVCYNQERRYIYEQTKIKELTLESFHKFGAFANMINPDAVKIGAKPVEFFRDEQSAIF